MYVRVQLYIYNYPIVDSTCTVQLYTYVCAAVQSTFEGTSKALYLYFRTVLPEVHK